MKVILTILLVAFGTSFYSQLSRKDIRSIHLINLKTQDTTKQEDRWIDSLTSGQLQSMIDYINSGNIYYIKTNIRKGKHYLSYQLTENDFRGRKMSSSKRETVFHSLGKTRSYSLFDERGKLLEKGKASVVNMTKYPKGSYTFIYDNGNIKESFVKN